MDPSDPSYDRFANQFFWLYQDGFTIHGDYADHHSFYPIQNETFETFQFADWHMIAIIAEEESVGGGMSKFSVYYDGQLYGSVSNNSPLVQFLTTPWKFAGPSIYSVGLGEYLGGLDDIRFFKRALDSEEVRLLYEAQQ